MSTANNGLTSAPSLADEQRLEIGQPNVTGPAIGIHDDRMRAFVIAAVDEKAGRARLPHFPESDFLFTHASPRHWSVAYQSAGRPTRASRDRLLRGVRAYPKSAAFLYRVRRISAATTMTTKIIKCSNAERPFSGALQIISKLDGYSIWSGEHGGLRFFEASHSWHVEKIGNAPPTPLSVR
ncbi:hypothetical protein [Bradyrhizobium sp. AZCC 2289]|uniref:hypothetical protein n=1 Tax=Bradyrhizobium sp. AZCC 2289 TaxID=3117026 RepID=UPI002FF0F492